MFVMLCGRRADAVRRQLPDGCSSSSDDGAASVLRPENDASSAAPSSPLRFGLPSSARRSTTGDWLSSSSNNSKHYGRASQRILNKLTVGKT